MVKYSHMGPAILQKTTVIQQIKLGWALFVTYTIIQSIMRSEMCSLHLTHPSVHTWSSGQPTVQRPGSSRGLPVGAGIRTHNLGLPRVSSRTLYPLSQRLSFTTVCCCIKKCNLNICYFRKKLYINSMQWCRGFSGPELISDNQIIISDSDESTFQLVSEKNRFRVLSPKDQRDHPDFHQWHMQKQTSVMVNMSASVQTAWVTCICVKVPLTLKQILEL